jgi:hypothetical protein
MIYGNKLAIKTESENNITIRSNSISEMSVSTFVIDQIYIENTDAFILKTFGLTYFIKNVGVAFVTVTLFIYKIRKDFNVIKFKVVLEGKHHFLVLNSKDLWDIFAMKLTEEDYNDKLKLISLFIKLLSKVAFESTFLYKRMLFVFSHETNQSCQKSYKNYISMSDENIAVNFSQRPYLCEHKSYFQSFIKKVLKINGRFAIVTFAEDYNRKNLFVLVYIPSSQRTLFAKFRITLLEENLPSTFVDLNNTYKKISPKSVNPIVSHMYKFRNSGFSNNKSTPKVKFDSKSEIFNNSSKPKVDYALWLQLTELTYEQNLWYIKFRNLKGVAKEFLSFNIISGERILIVTCIDNYMNQLDIFKPYYKILHTDLFNFNFEVTISKVSHFFKIVFGGNLEKIAYLNKNICNSPHQYINGCMVNEFVMQLEKMIIQRIREKGMRYKEISLNDLKKQKPRDQMKSLVLRNSIYKFQKLNSNSNSFLTTFQLIKNDQSILKRETIFSKVFTTQPRRIFTIYLEIMSKLISF